MDLASAAEARFGVWSSRPRDPACLCDTRHASKEFDAGSCEGSSDFVVVVGLLSPSARRLLLFAFVQGIRLVLLGRIGDLGHDVIEKVELLVLGDSLLEVDGADAFRVALLGFGSGFGDEGDHEEFEGFGCEGISICRSIQGGMRVTYRQLQE